jgi:hypothetical protein
MRIVDGDTREPARDPLALAVRRDTSAGVSANCLLIGRDGRETAIEDTAVPIHDRHGHVTGAVIVFHDVGAARAQSLRTSHLAQHDVLTGLPNRLLLTDRLERAVATACRHGTSLAVLFIDLDGFKRINDRPGHAIGDEVLRSVADRLVASVRRSDTVSRRGPFRVLDEQHMNRGRIDRKGQLPTGRDGMRWDTPTCDDPWMHRRCVLAPTRALA